MARLAAIALIAISIAACGGGGSRPVPEQPESFAPTRAKTARLAENRFVTRQGLAFQVAAGPEHLVWASGPVAEEARETELFRRDLRTGRTVTVARGIDVDYGIAATAEWVVYAHTDDTTRLVAARLDGSRSVELATDLLAPVAARGESVAWAERRGGVDRVMVRDMATGHEWPAASMAPCRRGRCYRIDRVTLANRGVSFTRVATAPDASEIVQRAFQSPRTRRLEIPGDPQPELVPSSAGALYSVLGQGWFRWDFGWARPRRTELPAGTRGQVLAYEDGRTFLVSDDGCRQRVIVRSDRGGRRRSVASAESLITSAGVARDGMCVHLGALAWNGHQPITSWGVIPERSEQDHRASGLVGIVDIAAPLER